MSDIAEATQLIGIALNPRAKPGATGANGEYRVLMSRYLEEGEFAERVHEVAEGFGLDILEGDGVRGLMLAVRSTSPFRATAADYLVGMTATERALYGLITIGIAACLYPNPVDLDNPHEPKRTVVQINEYLTQVADVVCGKIEGDAVPSDPRLWRVGQLYRKLADTKPNERAGSKTRESMIEKALVEMEKGALVRRVDDEAGAWTGTTRLRLRLRLGIGQELVEAVRKAAEATS